MATARIGEDWSREELAAAVNAYLEMESEVRAGRRNA
jgi:hypothetical protein